MRFQGLQELSNPATVKEYEKEFEAFQRWRMKQAFELELPAPESQVAAFLESVAKSRGPGCAGKALAAITKMHVFRNRPLPKSPLLRAMAKAFDQQKKRNSNPDKGSITPCSRSCAVGGVVREAHTTNSITLRSYISGRACDWVES